MAAPSLVIDCFPESVPLHTDVEAIVAIDVIRATTTAVTAVSSGRRCFPVPTVAAAEELRATLTEAVLCGEVGGDMPEGFDLNNSPAEIEKRTDIHRPLVLLSTSGTRVICSAAPGQDMYVSCLRNYRSQAEFLSAKYGSVALIGAGSKGEFREEDELCCAWIGELLVADGFEPADHSTSSAIERWSGRSVDDIIPGNSAAYLRRSGQQEDLEFVLRHVNDLQSVYVFQQSEIVETSDAARRSDS